MELWALPAEIQARFFRIAELIENHGLPNVGMPYIKHVQDEIWEIRISGKDKIGRGLYVSLSGQRVVILRFFIKKTQKTPKKEIKLAKERLRLLSNENITGIKK
jgi:phage-related protein